ncbi:MAG TPA: AAA family ATPase, partial [Planctomycetota bacterium]|nr:AAA family ATPase [Planctomycetota bacterium]
SMGRECIELCHRLFSRFRPYEAFPGKATQFLRDLFERAKRAKKSSIGLNDVLDLFTARTGLPELFLRDDLPLSSADALQYFESQVIGQDDPCRHASQLVATFKAGLNDPTRPLGVLLFCGPTGVGKTELARAIARYFFGHGDQADARMIRLDMSEYAGHDARERLLGGREQSQFLKQVRQQPFSVVLFDEIEKAAPEVFDLMLSLFDEGRLSDDTGRVVNFRSTIIILTSNIGADKFDAAGFHGERAPAYQVEAQSFFRPEFFNRLDAVVSFRPLDAEVIRKITVKELEAIAAREGLHSRGIRVRWTDKLVERIASVGVDRRYGARPLQRTLERMIIAPLSRWLIAHPKAGGGIRLDMSDDGSILIEPLL